MTSKLTVATAALLLVACAGSASAETVCRAATHSRFGETRAYFQNVLGACRPDGYCSAVVALPDRTGQGVYAHQLRVALTRPGEPYQVEFVAVTPMSAGDGQPMSITMGRQTTDLSALATPTSSINEFRVSDYEAVEKLVAGFRHARSARWTYQSGTGPASAVFSLSGMTAALTWIDCMGRRGR
jgi:hypothetical protein